MFQEWSKCITWFYFTEVREDVLKINFVLWILNINVAKSETKLPDLEESVFLPLLECGNLIWQPQMRPGI